MGGVTRLFEIKPYPPLVGEQKLLNMLHQFSDCRQGVSELTAVKYGIGLFGLSRRVPAKSVVE